MRQRLFGERHLCLLSGELHSGPEPLSIVCLRPLCGARKTHANNVAAEAGDIAKRSQDHGKEKHLNNVFSHYFLSNRFGERYGVGLFGDAQRFLRRDQRLIAHQPPQGIQGRVRGDGGDPQHVGVGQVMMSRKRQPQISVRELVRKLSQ